MINQVSSPEDRALAIAAIRDLEHGDAAALSAKLPPEQAERIASVLPQMRQTLPPPPRTTTPVDATYFQQFSGAGTKRQVHLTYEIAGGEKFALIRVGIVRDGSSAVINVLNITPLEGSSASLGAFTLTDKPLGQWLFLLLSLSALAITIAALIRVWRSGRFRRRWLWSLGCIVGIARITMNWASGEIFLQPLWVQIFSFAVFKPGLLAPWMISFSLPVVAIWALAHNRRASSPVAATFD